MTYKTKIETIILTYLTINKPRPYTSKQISQWINENQNTLHAQTTPKSIAKTITRNKTTMGILKDVQIINKPNNNKYYIKD